MRTDNDLEAVRRLRATEAEPSDLAVARTRRRVLAAVDDRASSTVYRRPKRLAIAAAAAAMVMVVGLVVVIQGVRGRPDTGQQAGSTPVASAEPSSTSDPTERSANPLPPLDGVVTPIQVPVGSVLYLRETYLPTSQVTEQWYDPEGGIMLRNGARDDPPGMPPNFVATAEEIAAAKAILQQLGPSLARPTPAYLATLPTDPSTLYAQIRDQIGRSGGGTMRDDLVLKNSFFFLEKTEPLLSPAVRAAYLGALARTPGVVVDHTPGTFAGRDVYLVKLVNANDTTGFVVDTATGRILGGFAFGGEHDVLEMASRWEYAIVPAAGQRP